MQVPLDSLDLSHVSILYTQGEMAAITPIYVSPSKAPPPVRNGFFQSGRSLNVFWQFSKLSNAADQVVIPVVALDVQDFLYRSLIITLMKNAGKVNDCDKLTHAEDCYEVSRSCFP